MYVRCAYFEGDVTGKNRERFKSMVRERIAPQMLRFPGIRHLRILWGLEHESPDRSIYLVIEHGYDSLEDIRIAISSEIRAGMQTDIDEVASLFDGRIYHVNYEATTLD